ncbi:MAG TPA: CHC2 zinc finger domain-containing protein [Chloroflexia bacterium]|nr:CHC2 zinc finger domain-containing protein [Chloroflexia bacterium]
MPDLLVVDLKRTEREEAYIEKLLAQPRWTDEEFNSLKAFLKFTEAERQQALESVPIELLLAGRGIHFPTGKRTPQIECFLPDHADSTASMTLYRSSNRCYCFGCRRKINTIDLLTILQGCTFPEAMDYLLGDYLRLPSQLLRRSIKQRLAEKQMKVQNQDANGKPYYLSDKVSGLGRQFIGFEKDDQLKEQHAAFNLTDHQPEIRLLLAAVVEYYHLQLKEYPPAWLYLTSRGLSQTTIQTHKLGYACGAGLVGWLRQQGLSLPLAREIGLLGEGAAERLAGRIIVPFFDLEGQLAMLTGRLLAGSTVEAPPWQQTITTGNQEHFQAGSDSAGIHCPKYLNLQLPKPSLDIFYPTNADHPGPVLLVEGPFDYLVARQWGHVAICTWGTAVNRENISLLGRALTAGSITQLLVCFDNDPPKTQPDGTVCLGAGPQATRQLLEQFDSPEVRAVELPAGFKDIASLGEIPQGRLLFEKAVNQALSTQTRGRLAKAKD